MRIATPNGIGDALFVEIGGAPQWVTIRGQDHFALTERSAAFLRALRERVQPLG